MKKNDCDDCVERRQFDFVQRIGRLGYWEYDPVKRDMTLPNVSQEILASIVDQPLKSFPHFMAVLSEAERQRFQLALDRVQAERQALHIELELASSHGARADILVRGELFKLDHGGLCIGGTFEDITEQKHAEEQLKRQRDEIKTIIDNFPGAISLCNADLRFTAYNNQLMTLLDFPPKLFAKGWVDFEDLVRFNASRGEYGPGDPEQQVQTALGRARNFQAHRFERPRPDGRWLEIRGMPIPSGGFVSIYIDITERKRIEAELVQAKEAAEARREQVASLLDHSGQGFLSFGSDLQVEPECSRACEAMLGQHPAGQDAAQVLFGADQAKDDLLRETVSAALGESDPWQCETMLSLLPGEFQRGDLLLKAEYRLIENKRVMVVLTDVTSERRLEQKVESERHRLEMIVAAVTESRDFFDTVQAFREFISGGIRALLESPVPSALMARELYRQVHTFKGLLNQFSFVQTPLALHALESQLEGLRQLGTKVTREAIGDLVQAVPMAALLEADLALLRDALGDEFLESGDRIVLSTAQALQLQQLAAKLLRGEAIDTTLCGMRELLLQIGQLRKLALQDALYSFERLVSQTAERLNKEVAPLRVTGDSDVWIDPVVYKPLLRSLTHIFRNAVVHGIEDPDTRLQRGKPELGTISCNVALAGKVLKLSIADDGAGIDLEALRRRTVALGLYAPDEIAKMTDEKILDLIFLDNLSTQPEATELAGRGVGLAVVRSEARKLGGDVVVRTTPGQGTQFVFTLPLQCDTVQT
jgi:PAS domain-containing protein/two-component sensor histidine kinase